MPDAVVSVAIILDPDAPKELAALASQMHTWVVASASNLQLVDAFLKNESPDQRSMFSASRGLTTFVVERPGDREANCRDVLDEVIEHHFGHGSASGKQRLFFVGVKISGEIQQALEERGFKRVQSVLKSHSAWSGHSSLWERDKSSNQSAVTSPDL